LNFYNFPGRELLSLEDLRDQSFPSKTKLDWKVKAEESLKGKSIESLQSPTYENIILKPLYSREDERPVSEYPGSSDFRRGSYQLGYLTNEWKVAQQVSYSTIDELKEKLTAAIEKGQTAISFEVSKGLFESAEEFSLGDLSEKYPFAVNTKGMQAAILANLTNGKKVTGYIGEDPISLFAEEGKVSEEYFEGWLENIKLASELYPNLRTILVDASTYHNNAANAVQELGIAAAEGVFYLQHLLDKGMKLEKVLSKMIFKFSIGSNFFMEIAKLRAARIIWNKIAEAYEAHSDSRGMEIAAETSSFTKTIYDPHVNLLRAGNEAFAAVLGGIQYLHVTAFDELTGSIPFSERIARNTQLILKEEAHLQKVIDPAGGSWYIEELTTQLAEKAWEFFQQIEAKGGILEVLKSSWLQQEIAAVSENRIKDIFTRKQSIVGTNVFANLDEVVPIKIRQKVEHYFVSTTLGELLNGAPVQISESFTLIEAISKKRLAEPYEQLRKIANEIETPTIGMICLGELKQYKARLDFMRGFVSAGGIKTVNSGTIFSADTAKVFISNQNTKHFCLCGINEQYETIGHTILKELKASFPDRIFYLAGIPEKDKQAQWMNEGIQEFIHVKSNCYEILAAILSEMEVKADAKA
jgi:methylmalonyl-CoA mutase